MSGISSIQIFGDQPRPKSGALGFYMQPRCILRGPRNGANPAREQPGDIPDSKSPAPAVANHGAADLAVVLFWGGKRPVDVRWTVMAPLS